VYTKIDGPRLDVQDTTIFWLNAHGAPRKIVDALGGTTILYRGDTRFPGLVTRVVRPLGLADSATYDARGNILTNFVAGPYADGRDATTRYAWNNFDFATTIVPPEGDSTVITYDASGNRIGQQDARGSTAQVQFNVNTQGQVTSTSTPVQRARGFARDSVQYDNLLENVLAVRTPSGDWSRSFADAFGRDTLSTSPVSSDTTLKQQVRTTYDAMGRVLTSTTIGPAMNSAPSLTLFVRHFYTAGLLDSTVRWAQPDTNNIQTVATGWRYDRAELPRI
jgi:YD repeat-containing protein